MLHIHRLIDEGHTDEAAAALRERMQRRQDLAGEHDLEALAAEQLGLSTVALRAWQLVVRDEPNRLDAWEALATLHEERGDHARASACRERAVSMGASPRSSGAVVRDEPSQERNDGPTDADLVRFLHLFAGREEVHARMWHDPVRGSGYSPVHQALTPELLSAHLAGSITAGMYMVTANELASVLVFDLDATKDALGKAAGDEPSIRSLRAEIHEEGVRLLRRMRELGLDPVLEDSGYKGRHLWCFLPAPMSAERVRDAGRRIAALVRPESPRLALEVFPKQGTLKPGGLGNLVKLPLGIHLKTGRRCPLLDDDGAPCAAPFARLREVRRVPLSALGSLLQGPPPAEVEAPRLKEVVAAPAPPPPAAPDWSEADFDTHHQIGGVLRSCAVLNQTVRQALEDKRLSRDALVALQHSLGHLPAGVRACNYLADHIPGFAAEARMGAHHRGSPISCKRLQQRLGGENDQTASCACSFPDVPGRYPNPLRHLDDLDAPVAPSRTLDELLDAYARQLARQREIANEVAELRRAVVTALGTIPGGRWARDDGEWRLEQDGGLPVLRWHTKAA